MTEADHGPPIVLNACSKCGHGYSERCPRCGCAFGCGSLSELCACGEKRIAFDCEEVAP